MSQISAVAAMVPTAAWAKQPAMRQQASLLPMRRLHQRRLRLRLRLRRRVRLPLRQQRHPLQRLHQLLLNQ